MKTNKLKKVFDKCKVIHALKQPKSLLHLLNRPKVQNCIFEKHGLYCYECKDSRYNLCASYIQECSNFITSNGYNWKIRCNINCHSTNALYFLSRTSCNGNTTYTGKTVNFRHRMNNHITACRYGTSQTNLTIMFLNVAIQRNMLPKNLILKFMFLYQSIMKINCYAMNLTYIK